MISVQDFRKSDLEERLSGVIVPIVTPLLKGQVDSNSMNRLATFLIGSGVHGLFFLGHTGEFEYLSVAQKKQVIDTATRLESRQAKIFVGTSGETLEETVELSKYSRQKGVDAVVIAPRYKTELSTFDYLQRVLDQSSGPVILYNNPAITDNKKIEIEDLKILLAIPKYKRMIIGIKDSSADAKYFSQLLQLRNRSHPKMAVFQGSESVIVNTPYVKYPHLRPDGIVPGSANYHPKLLLGIFNSIREGHMPMGITTLKSYIAEYDERGDPIIVIKERLALGYKIPRTPAGSRIDFGYDEINPKLIVSAELAQRKAA